MIIQKQKDKSPKTHRLFDHYGVQYKLQTPDWGALGEIRSETDVRNLQINKANEHTGQGWHNTISTTQPNRQTGKHSKQKDAKSLGGGSHMDDRGAPPLGSRSPLNGIPRKYAQKHIHTYARNLHTYNAPTPLLSLLSVWRQRCEYVQGSVYQKRMVLRPDTARLELSRLFFEVQEPGAEFEVHRVAKIPILWRESSKYIYFR